MPHPSRCRCHSGRLYRRCCQPLHEGRPAATPEALMRSRYAAYAMRLVDHVIDTTDPDGPRWETDVDAWRTSIEAFCRGTRFEGLRIGGVGDDGEQGWVQFRAVLSRGGQDVSFEERSLFVRRGGRWVYHNVASAR